MKGLIGESARLSIKYQINNNILFYTATKITEISDTHIFFIDKYNKHIGFRLLDVIQIELV